jgi:SAM-dependent methyltransferase
MYQPDNNGNKTVSKKEMSVEAKAFWSANGPKVLRAAESRDPELTIHRIQRVLTPELLKGGYSGENSEAGTFFGHCYTATEALYYLLGKEDSGFVPWQARHNEDVTHWWLQNDSGDRLDPTRAQFDTVGEIPPYEKGGPRQFLTQYTGNPCWRASEIIRRVVDLEAEESLSLSCSASSKLDEFRRNELTLREHDYPVDRGLIKKGSLDKQTYISITSPELYGVLQGLTARDRWLDVGPGEFFAVHDYYFSGEFPGKAKAIALNLTPLEDQTALEHISQLNQELPSGKFSYNIGDVLDLSPRETGKLSLITDIYAAFCYSPAIDEVLAKYAELLKPGGHLALVARGTSFVDENGKKVSLKKFFESLPGFEVVGASARGGFLLKRTKEDFVMPPIELVEFVARDTSKKVYFPHKKYQVHSWH